MRVIALALPAALGLAVAVPAAQAEPYTLDKSHTAIIFTIDHLGFSLTQGRFADFDAEATIERTDYGISYGAGAIGNDIPVRVDLEMVKDR